MKKVLITGGAGFIGRHFVEKLKDKELVILDLNIPDFPTSASFIRGDVRKAEDVRKAMQGVDTVIHLAAMHHDFGISDAEYYATNVEGARIITEEASRQDVKQIINFSSVAVYGGAGNPGPTTEATPVKPGTAYGKSKLMAEDIMMKWAEAEPSRKVITIRSTVVFGPWNLANVLSLIRIIDRGYYIQIGKGDNIKSLAYVGNIVDAAIFALNTCGKGYHLFNYADSPQMSSRQIAEMQAGMLGRKIHIRVPFRMGMMLARPFDLLIALSGKNLSISSARVKKLQTQTFHSAQKILELGFVPKVNIPEGMQEMINWYLKSHKR